MRLNALPPHLAVGLELRTDFSPSEALTRGDGVPGQVEPVAVELALTAGAAGDAGPRNFVNDGGAGSPSVTLVFTTTRETLPVSRHS